MTAGKSCAALMFAASMLFGGWVAAGEIAVKNGDAIAFLGDSITNYGNNGDGYLTMTLAGLKAAGIEAKKIPAGRSGHKSDDMLKRLDRDVLRKKPQFMVLSCGVNDVWHQSKRPPRGVSLEDYRKNVAEIIGKAQAAGVKVVVMTATMIREDAADGRNVQLAAYNDFLREIAAEKNCILADQNKAMQELVASYRKRYPDAGKRNFVTTDGVHMNPAGNRMMATTLLRALGLDGEQMKKAEKAIDALPTRQGVAMSISDYDLLAERSLEKNMPFSDCAGELFRESLKRAGEGEK
ncbi:MAG: G-D-S-L family lipolytic protein [Lentisphaeria bacterium]|nr:G-D-S-L family lipolytic protein [Lentisphaeria bacterium]